MYLSPQRRTFDRPVEDAVVEFLAPAQIRDLPAELAALVDLRDPDLEYVADSLRLLRLAGLDVDDPDIFQMGIDAGHRRAVAALDDTRLSDPAHQRAEARARAEFTERWVARQEARSVVYYMRLGNRVKIGYTVDVIRRQRQIQPEELLATERGGPKLEAERHRQFAPLRVVGEWFRYEGALVDHIAELRHA